MFGSLKSLFFFLLLVSLGITVEYATAADWPMWRHDANRSAVSPTSISTNLYLQWVLTLPAFEKAYPDASNARITFDDAYRPVVMGKNLFVCSPVYDSITAYDTETGNTNWTFFADAPMRFAPACSTNGNIYSVSDDGYLYCLDASDGTLKWKFRGAPNGGQILANKRLGSTWPARGGPVVLDNKVYFTAGVWPFMGVFIYEIDADTGAVNWVNDGTGSDWVLLCNRAAGLRFDLALSGAGNAGTAGGGAFCIRVWDLYRRHSSRHQTAIYHHRTTDRRLGCQFGSRR